MIIRTHAYPRAGLIGNPSDGYFGKTIAFTFRQYRAQVELWESPEMELLPSRRDHSIFPSICHLHQDVKQHGYYGGFRLLKASCKCFLDYCSERGIVLDNRNFTLRYSSDIPGQVGLAGSSAIITACIRALMGFYNVQISRHSLAKLVHSVENVELSIPAGLQDRVAQAYQGVTFMDFDSSLMEQRGYGDYVSIDVSRLPPVFIAFREDLAEGTEVYHNDLRLRFRRGDTDVLNAIERWGQLAVELKELLEQHPAAEPDGDAPFATPEMHALINENFDLRNSLYNVGEGNRDMVETARGCGASAKFAGSGGAIVGFLESAESRERLVEAFRKVQITVLFPDLV
jgi:glucuronokinase